MDRYDGIRLTGDVALDRALGGRGLPRGGIVECCGSEAFGRTACCMKIVASIQRRGGVAALIDAEQSIDGVCARSCGVDLRGLVIAQPGSRSEAFAICRRLAESGAVDVVVLDSLPALSRSEETAGAERRRDLLGLRRWRAYLAMRRMRASLVRSGTLCLVADEGKDRVGVTFGEIPFDPEARAFESCADIRLRVGRAGIARGRQDEVEKP